MKIYLVKYMEHYEPSYAIKAFASKEKAYAYMKQLEEEDPRDNGWYIVTDLEADLNE